MTFVHLSLVSLDCVVIYVGHQTDRIIELAEEEEEQKVSLNNTLATTERGDTAELG